MEKLCLPLGGLALKCYEFVKKNGMAILDDLSNNIVNLFVKI